MAFSVFTLLSVQQMFGHKISVRCHSSTKGLKNTAKASELKCSLNETLVYNIDLVAENVLVYNELASFTTPNAKRQSHLYTRGNQSHSILNLFLEQNFS